MQQFELIIGILAIAATLIAALDYFGFARYREAQVKPPLVAEWARDLWWVLLLVLLIRCFVFDLVKVPSGSMLPTIQLGDMLIINKLAYGVHSPVNGNIWLTTGAPKPGDVVVLRYPVNPDVYFVKRLIGLPGDKIEYRHKQLTVNGHLLPQTYLGTVSMSLDAGLAPQSVKQYQETDNAHQYVINQVATAPDGDFVLTVPKDKYFVMGDDRDASADSRYWGYVPAQDLVGKAWRIIFSWDSEQHRVRWQRIGNMLS
jgi:signal peptidase I